MFCFPSNIGLISSLKAAFISLYSGYFNSRPFFSKFSVLGEGVVFVGDFFYEWKINTYTCLELIYNSLYGNQKHCKEIPNAY